MPGWPPGIWAMDDNSPSQFLSDAGVRHAHLPHVAVLLHRRLLRAAAVSEARARARSGRNRGHAHPGSARSSAGWCCSRSSDLVWTMGITKVFGGAPPPMPRMPEGLGCIPAHAPVVPLRAAADVRGGHRAARLSSTLRRATQKLRNLVDAAVAKLDSHAASRCSRSASRVAVRADVAAVLVLLAGHPDSRQSLIPQVPAAVGFGTAFIFGWLVHRSQRRARRHRARLVRAPGARHRRHRLAAAHHARHARWRNPGITKTLFALVFGVAVWGWVFGLTGAALRFLSNYSAGAPLHRRCFLLDLPRAPAGGRGVRRSGWVTGRCTGASSIRSSWSRASRCCS